MISVSPKRSKHASRAMMWTLLSVTVLLIVLAFGYYLNWFDPLDLSKVELPSYPASEASVTPSFGIGGNNTSTSAQPSPVRIDVTTGNVQEIVKTLARPAAYQSAWTVELFWAGGSSKFLRNVYVRDGYTKLELFDAQNNLTEEHIVGGGRSFVWNPNSSFWQTVQGDLTADDEAWLPTYETILSLDKSSIITAEYLIYQDMDCVHVETQEKNAHYVDAYWISLSDGLPILYESRVNEKVAVRCTRVSLEQLTPADEHFMLPNRQLAMDVTS